jgi:lipoprotein-releasing system ATP-binding protein
MIENRPTLAGQKTAEDDFLVKAENINKSFKKGGVEIPVVRDVSLSIRPREMVSIMGASGVGKSTLLHILGTLEQPTSGKFLFRWEEGPARRSQTQSKEASRSLTPMVDVFGLSHGMLSHFRNRMLGFVFQFHHLLPEFSALENVMMPALIAGYSRAASKQQAEDLLKFVGLSNRLSHRPGELSGGEQQRIAIARAVILRPKLLLADELTGNLDSANRAVILELLKRLNETTGIAVLLVTHDDEVAAKMDRRLEMKDGRMVNSI